MHIPNGNCVAVILVVNDDEETRDAIGKLLAVDGYCAEPARTEQDAIERAAHQGPDLILITMDGTLEEMVASANRIRTAGGLANRVPIVLFCVPVLDEGAEVAIGDNIYVTRPDNFNQLRALIYRLLLKSMLVA